MPGCGVIFVRFMYELGGTGAPLLGGVAVFSHYCEEGEYNITGFFGEVLEDLVG